MSGDDSRTVRDLLNAQQREDLKYAYGRALGYARGVLKLEKWHAEEVVQAAALRAIERINSYRSRPGVPFTAWLNRVLQNLVRDEHRHRKRTERLRDLAGDATTPSALAAADLQMINAQAKLRRDQILARLRPDTRIVFETWAEQHAGHFNRSEAAARLGYSLEEFEAAKKRVRREVENAMEALALTVDDIRSQLPMVANSKPTQARGEEEGA